MKILVAILCTIALSLSAKSENWTPVIKIEEGITSIILNRRDLSIILDDEVYIRRICHSTTDHDLVFELWKSRGIGHFAHAALVCDWDDRLEEWFLSYQLTTDELTLMYETKSRIGGILDTFSTLDEVPIVISYNEQRELPSLVLRRWELWNLKLGVQIMIFEDGEFTNDMELQYRYQNNAHKVESRAPSRANLPHP